MATAAIEKIEKIENVHDDGASTRASDIAASSRDSESTMDNGKARLERCGRLKGRENSHENVNENESDCLPSSLVRDQIIDNNSAVSIEPQLTETFRIVSARHYQEPLKRPIKIQSWKKKKNGKKLRIRLGVSDGMDSCMDSESNAK